MGMYQSERKKYFHIGDTYIIDKAQYGRTYCMKQYPALLNNGMLSMFVDLPYDMDTSITGADINFAATGSYGTKTEIIFMGNGYYAILNGDNKYSKSHISILFQNPKTLQITAKIKTIDSMDGYSAPTLTSKALSGFARFNDLGMASIIFT